jgi:hypothetical protein
MPTREELLSEFIDAWNAGRRPHVEDYLERAPANDRDELASLIATFLEEAPTPDYSDETFAAILEEKAVAEAARLPEGESGFWPALLPRLRNRARLKRDEVVQRLAEALAVTGKAEKVHRYYHEMETGTLDPAGVSGRVIDALAGILGADAHEIERAGSFHPAIGSKPAALLARAENTGDDLDEDFRVNAVATRGRAAPRDWDEVDRLFLGGR